MSESNSMNVAADGTDTRWQEFLKSRGDATPEVETPDRIPADRACIIDLSELAVLSLSGSEAVAFMSAQFTCDLRSFQPASLAAGAWCNPQGQVLTNFRLFASDDACHLLLSRSLRNSIAKRLAMYVLRADVAVRPAEDEPIAFGLIGNGAERLLSLQPGSSPTAERPVAAGAAGMVVRLPGAPPRYAVLADRASAQHLWRQWRGDAVLGHQDIWFAQDIATGWPVITPASSERYLPQMLNLEAFGALSYDKGCYPGQEIIARLKFRGQLKRRLELLHADAEPRYGAGTDVYDAEANVAGQIIDARSLARGRLAALAVLALGATAAPLHLGAPDGPAMQPAPLPESA